MAYHFPFDRIDRITWKKKHFIRSTVDPRAHILCHDPRITILLRIRLRTRVKEDEDEEDEDEEESDCCFFDFIRSTVDPFNTILLTRKR